MKIGLGKYRKFYVEGKQVRAVPTSMEVSNGKTYWYLREALPPHESYWYNTKDKKKLNELKGES